MFGREELEHDQVVLMVVQALRETIMDPTFTIEDDENPKLERDLDIDDAVMADLVESLEREFELQVSGEDAERWVTVWDVVLGMMTICDCYADQVSHLEDDEDDEDDKRERGRGSPGAYSERPY